MQERERSTRRNKKTVPTPPRRSSHRQQLSKKSGILGKITGRAQLDEFKEDRYKPYQYESNGKTIKWLGGILGLWIVLTLALFWADRSTIALYTRWRDDEGLTAIPPNALNEDLIQFGHEQGINCETFADQDFLAEDSNSPCVRLIGYLQEFRESSDSSAILFFFTIPLLIVASFVFGNFVYKAGRNLLTLHSGGQRFQPEMAVFWLFIPIANLFRPYQVFTEMFKASDPSVPPGAGKTWRNLGSSHILVYLWQVVFVSVLFFNPLTVLRLWFRNREGIDEAITAIWGLAVSDLILAMFGAVSFALAFFLYRRQDARRLAFGVVTARPRRVDPLAEVIE